MSGVNPTIEEVLKVAVKILLEERGHGIVITRRNVEDEGNTTQRVDLNINYDHDTGTWLLSLSRQPRR